jgi:hypothetical protein
VPGVEHQADRLLDLVAAAVEILAESDELVRPVARADAQPHAAVGEDVDERRVLDHADRVVQRQRDHRRADIDAAGLGREVGHVGEAVRHDAVAGREMVLGDPGGVVAQALGFDHFVRGAGVHVAVGVGLFLRVGMRGEEDAEFHAIYSLCGDPSAASDQTEPQAVPFGRKRVVPDAPTFTHSPSNRLQLDGLCAGRQPCPD